MGEKFVTINNELILNKNVTGYVFVLGPGLRGDGTYSKLELPAGKAVELPDSGRWGATLFAIPEAVAKEFKTDKELYDALKNGAVGVQGVQSMGFTGRTTRFWLVIGNSVKWTTTITGIDANGIKTKVEGKGAEPEAKPGKDTPAVQTPHGVPCVGSIAAFAALTFGGFWLVGRVRRKA